MASALPPSLSLPAVVQTYRFMKNPLPLLRECKEKLGDVFTIPLAGIGGMVFLTRPEDIRQMYVGEATQALSGAASNKMFFGPIVGPGSVLGMDGEPHLQRRRLLMPLLHGERVKGYVEDMRQLAIEAMAAWPLGKPFSIMDDMAEMGLKVILRTVFGVGGNGRENPLTPLLTDVAKKVLKSPLLNMPALQWDLGKYSPWGRLQYLLRQTDRALQAEIARRRASTTPLGHDLLSTLLEVKDEDGRQLSDSEIRDELVGMLVAGNEPVGFGLAWAFERILSNPSVYAKLEEELERVLGDNDVDAQSLPKLEYLDALVKEVLRSRPLAPIGGTRKVLRPVQMAGHSLPEGTIVTNCTYLLLNRPEVYPEPEAFKPERFLNTRENPYEWTVFGGGARRCIGMSLALTQMKVVLATAFSRARFATDLPHARAARAGFFLVPEGNGRIRMVARKEKRNKPGISSAVA